MALQGTLDTFELPDVLRLLASTKKSGRLTLRSDRGEGDVWLADGRIVDVVAGAAPTAGAGDGLFELLRAHEGSFAFEPGAEPGRAGDPAEVEPMLAAAEEALAEWRTIEAVVPSMDAWVSLAPELEGDQVTVDAATWKLVARIGSGLTVSELGRALDLGEVPVCRLVRDLVGLGLTTVSAAAEPTWGAAANGYDHGSNGHHPVVEDAHEDDDDEAPAPTAPAEPVSFADLPSFVDPEPVAPVFAVDEPAGYGAEPGIRTATVFDDDVPPGPAHAAADDTEDEVARQLAMLSPRAAQAVAAAAAAEQSDGGPVEGAGDDDEAGDRGLLLKFLSSVKS
jgi:hypothetical protein